MKTYGSYVFKDKDPSIDELRTVIEDHYGAKIHNALFVDIEALGGPASSTMYNWFFGDTLRPQNPTLEAAGRAIGYKRQWVKFKDVKANGAAKPKRKRTAKTAKRKR